MFSTSFECKKMRLPKIISVFVFLLCSNAISETVFAQGVSNPEPGTQITTREAGDPAEIYIYEKDTLVDGKTYYMLVEYDSLVGRRGWMTRTQGDQVYMRSFTPGGMTGEIVWYDYSLTVGNTIDILAVTFTVQSTGTITLLNGETRRTWELTSPSLYGIDHDVTWIEGLGSDYGIDYNLLIGNTYRRLVCVANYEDGNIFITDDTSYSGDCAAPPVGRDEFSQELNNILVFPQPAENDLIIQAGFHLEGAVQIELLDLSGRLIFKEWKRMKGETIQLSTEGIPGGMYALRLTNKGNVLGNQKVLIRR